MSAPFADVAEPWRRHRVLHEDSDTMVVDKPAGVSTVASDRSGDDLVGRLRTFVAVRDGVARESVYASLPRALERDTSGAVLVVRKKPANASLVRQIERGEFRTTYVAIVASGPRRDAGHVGADRVAFRVLERHGERAMVAFGPTALGSAALRAALAESGVTLARSPTAHPLIHSQALSYVHPSSGTAVTVEAPIPARLADALAHRTDDPLASAARMDAALDDAALLRTALFGDPGTDSFRIANAEGDGVPHVTVDRYGAWALVQLYEALDHDTEARVLDAVHRLGARGVYVKYRPKQANELVDTRRDDLAPMAPVRGEAAPDEFAIHENGLAYRVRLGDGLSTGIFLDQRENRRRVREMAPDRRVLNLFAYTGAFGVAAGAGGARHVLNIDVSAGALAWAERNLHANGLDAARNDRVTADVFGWLEGARARGDRFDLVLLDPPSYATTKEGTRFSAASDYRALAARVFPLLDRGGSLLACSNHRGIVRAKLRRYLHEAARDAGCSIARMRDLDAPDDFPAPEGYEPHLKTVFVTVS